MSWLGGLRILVALAVLLCGAAESQARPAGRSPKTVIVAADLPPALTQLLAATASSSHILRSLAIDLDRDGDLDVVASTADALLVVWLNDGAGHLVPAHPVASTWLRADGWRLRPPVDDPLVDDQQAGSKARHDISVGAHSPHIETSTARLESPDAVAHSGPARDRRTSRGPPAPLGV